MDFKAIVQYGICRFIFNDVNPRSEVQGLGSVRTEVNGLNGKSWIRRLRYCNRGGSRQTSKPKYNRAIAMTLSYFGGYKPEQGVQLRMEFRSSKQ